MRNHHRQLAGAVVVLIAVVASVTVALAGSSKLVVKTANNATLGKTIVVDTKGKTLYRLSGETATKLKCTTSQCFSFWPPFTVSSKKTKLRAGAGVHGKLTVLKRTGVTGFQVLLGGKPLYHFAADAAAGDAKGNGIVSFGGTWSAVSASGGSSSSSTGTTTGSAPAPAAPGY